MLCDETLWMQCKTKTPNTAKEAPEKRPRSTREVLRSSFKANWIPKPVCFAWRLLNGQLVVNPVSALRCKVSACLLKRKVSRKLCWASLSLFLMGKCCAMKLFECNAKPKPQTRPKKHTRSTREVLRSSFKANWIPKPACFAWRLLNGQLVINPVSALRCKVSACLLKRKVSRKLCWASLPLFLMGKCCAMKLFECNAKPKPQTRPKKHTRSTREAHEKHTRSVALQL